MGKINNLKFGKRFVAGVLALSITGGLIYGGIQLHKKCEVSRVKGYLEDFVTEENYVDLSKVTSDYKIRNFSGEALIQAMEDTGVDYVRLNDSYIYDGATVTPFTQITAINYDKVLWTDQYDNTYYEQYEPIRATSPDGVMYAVPNGYELEKVKIYAEPTRYEKIENDKIIVIDNDYEDSYSLILKRNK